ncbi:hypothetical protein BON30_44080 [Cystobacter ferrugineus]|uniref:Probable cysteine desulfurase n=1 Tax=Cystobacter ferrugineus TaxID=83449 RepID=A0A1L9AWH2_9BACT|nr:hypothetical protein BON30_44080 [Cystobacter ferrugineus]
MGSAWAADFPALKAHGRGSYLDSAATALKPTVVTDAVVRFYREETAPVHRGSYRAAERVTETFEAARQTIAAFIGASTHEVAFFSSCTDAINQVAAGLELGKDDEVVLSVLEHNSNLAPWLERVRVRCVGVGADGRIDPAQLDAAIGPRTKLVTCTAVSNVTGNVQPIAEICAVARRRGVPTLIDAAQAVGHTVVDVRAIGCDFLAFSGHKVFGPSGVGVLYGREESFERLRPLRVGGGAITRIDGERIFYRAGHQRLESGTPNIEGVIGLSAAIEYLVNNDFPAMVRHQRELEAYAWQRLSSIDALHWPFPRAQERIPIFSFSSKRSNVDLSMIAALLADNYGIAVRIGQHCCHPLFAASDTYGAIRASFHIYNSAVDVDRLADALSELAMLF